MDLQAGLVLMDGSLAFQTYQMNSFNIVDLLSDKIVLLSLLILRHSNAETQS